MNSDRKKIKLWVESWKRSAVELEKEKRNKLRVYDYSKNQAFIDKMLQWACENKKIRLSTGLVEQQRLFMKTRSNYPLKTDDGKL